ncbi:MAG: LL-diaminopimelate aminotransferase [Erysipelotrichaceae bacterium]|jgi:LL-diaminopimelate aminotransferase
MLNKDLLDMETVDIYDKVTEKVNSFKSENPNARIISLGIGDVSKPIVQPVIEAMHKAVEDLSDMETFKGYGGYYGYDFLREAILKNEYQKYGFSKEEIYVSDGTKTDSTGILELFDKDSTILLGNPTYPIYRDGAKALSRKVEYTNVDENFVMEIPDKKYDIVYICSPNNPVGNAYTRNDLQKWVSYALKNRAVIIFDNVYQGFVRSRDVPKSIYEIEEAKNCVIELRSFSKTASFTGLRCSYYVIPNQISQDINVVWKRRTINRFNGASYIAQKAAEAVYLPESQKLIKENIDYYLENARILKEGFEKDGYKVSGGIDAPFIWVKSKDMKTSWQMFDYFLKKLNIVVIPGIIFGSNGDSYIRISALGKREDGIECIGRILRNEEKN